MVNHGFCCFAFVALMCGRKYFTHFWMVKFTVLFWCSTLFSKFVCFTGFRVESESLQRLSANYCALLPPPRSTIAAAFSPDGKTLASTQ